MSKSYQQKEQERKRAAAIKASLLEKASLAIEGLWVTSNQTDSGFTTGERMAIAKASYEIKAIRGGWAARRTR